MDQYLIIRKPVITEKSTAQAKNLTYCFEVAVGAHKGEIRKAVEKKFGVHIIAISTMITKGRKKRTGKKRAEINMPTVKKAMVTVAKGEKIDLFIQEGKDESR